MLKWERDIQIIKRLKIKNTVAETKLNRKVEI